MQLVDYFWYFKSALSPQFCEEVIRYCQSKEKLLGVTGHYNHPKELNLEQLKDLKQKRNSDVVWVNDQWIMNEIYPYINMANKNAGWNFAIDAVETAQFTEYKKDQFYGWHSDQFEKPYGAEDVSPDGKKIDPVLKGRIRKLSVTVLLSDPKDYEGGELEFQYRNKDDPNLPITCLIREKGSVIVFPSFVWHRVRSVTKGVRHSLVIWNLGYPFK
jgi:PKHD-type hydroxylase